MSDPNLIADLARAGLDPVLLQRVAMELARAQAASEAIEQRRLADRERQSRRRGHAMSRDVTLRHVTSRDVTGHDVTSRDAPAASLDVPPLPPAPPSPPLNPPTTPDILGACVNELPAKASTKRGHRIPEDFAQRPEAFAVCAEFGLAGGQASEALAEFVDFWAALPGQKATKLDWFRTLRNRLRRLREMVRRREPPSGRPPPTRGNGFGQLAAQKRAARQMEDADEHATEHHADRPVRHAQPGAAGSAQGDARCGYGDGPGQVLDLVARRAYG